MHFLPRLLALFFIALTPCSALAHHAEPGGDPAAAGDFSIGGGVMLESGDEAGIPKFLVAVAYRGVEQKTGNHHVTYRYFWVSGQIVVSTKEQGWDSVDSLQVNIVPVTRITTTHEGLTTSIRYAPIQIERDLDLGIAGSVTVQAIGWSLYSETPLIGKYQDHQLARLTKFAQVAVDVLGLRYASLVGGDAFTGLELGTVQARAGLAWNIDENVSLRLSLGTRLDGAVGEDVLMSRPMALAEGDFFARLELALKTAFSRLTFFLEGGRHEFSLFGGSGGGLDGHWYMMIGISGTF